MILFGDEVAHEVMTSLKEQLILLYKQRPPKLSVILVGEDKASHIYVSMKQKSCAKIGILSETLSFPDTVTEHELLATIEQLNKDDSVDGILVQLPLPSHIHQPTLFSTLLPSKDVDGFHPINMGKLLLGEKDGFIPCTPLGIQKLLHYYSIPIEGQHIVIVGRSSSVGKPLAALLMQKEAKANATVTLCHSGTRNLAEHTKHADILIAACGVRQLITAPMVKKDAYVIDVGIHRIEKPNGIELVGDVDFDQVHDKVKAITPVPRGVGPMTVAMLLQNTIKSYQCHIS